jgi:hypothetical protein
MGKIGDLSGGEVAEREPLTFDYFTSCEREHRCRDADCEDADDDDAEDHPGMSAPREHTHPCRGREMRVHPDATDLHWTAFLDRAATMPDDFSTADAVRASMDYVKQQIHPDDWADFWAVSVAHGRTTEQLLGVAQAIVEAVTGFPTGQASDSSRGRNDTTGSSRGVSSRQERRAADRADAKQAERKTRATREAMRALGPHVEDGEQLPGRAELQSALLQKAARDGVLPREWMDFLPEISAHSPI